MTGLDRMIAMAREESRAAAALWDEGDKVPRRRVGAPGEKRGAKRGFDWDLAAKLKGEGLSLSQIGARLGVSKASVSVALKIMRGEA